MTGLSRELLVRQWIAQQEAATWVWYQDYRRAVTEETNRREAAASGKESTER